MIKRDMIFIRCVPFYFYSRMFIANNFSHKRFNRYCYIKLTIVNLIITSPIWPTKYSAIFIKKTIT
ncbi:hypothetical protein TK34_10045 [Aeromonas hydrophila]|nr:hypothetical protein TK34_10045 [Aeromonas hydrophila]